MSSREHRKSSAGTPGYRLFWARFPHLEITHYRAVAYILLATGTIAVILLPLALVYL